MPHRDQEITLLRREIEMLMGERQLLLQVVGSSAALIASLDLLPQGKTAVTADLHVSVMRTAPPGQEITLLGRVVRPGATLFFCEAEAIADGKLIASARLTKAVVDLR